MPYNVPTVSTASGTPIPLLAWGCGGGEYNKDPDLATRAGVVVLNAGIRHIDTAQQYKTEKEAGEAVRQSGLKRDEVFITTKISEVETNPEAIRAQVLDSISKLGSKPNLLLVHNPYVPAKGKIGAFWTILEDLVYDGTLEGVTLGVSNFRIQDLEEVDQVARIKPAVHQLEYHPYVLTHLKPILDHASANNTLIEAYGPLTPLLRHPTGGPIKPVLERIAKRFQAETGDKNIDATAVLLKWTNQKGVVAVTGSTNEGRIAKLAGVQRLPELSEDEVEEIESLGRKVHFRNYTEHLWEDFPVPDLPEDL